MKFRREVGCRQKRRSCQHRNDSPGQRPVQFGRSRANRPSSKARCRAFVLSAKQLAPEPGEMGPPRYRPRRSQRQCPDDGNTVGNADILAAANMVVIASRHTEHRPCLREAFASGRPVVATRVGDVPEIIVHGENGLSVQPNVATRSATAYSPVLR